MKYGCNGISSLLIDIRMVLAENAKNIKTL